MTKRILPAYPLFVKSPDFSLWSTTDDLTESNVVSWWGEAKPVYGFVRTEEGAFCFLGNFDDVKDFGAKRAVQTGLNASSFTTDYEFDIGKAKLKVSFVSPLLPTDTDMISMPACYINYEITGAKSAELSLFANRRVCYNDVPQTPNKEVRGAVVKCLHCETAFFGLKRQLYLASNDDRAGADCGYFYAAGKEAYLTDAAGMAAYVRSGTKEFPLGGDEKYAVALGDKKGRLAVAYDDIVAIDYFGNFRKTAYLENHTVFDALFECFEHGDDTDGKLSEFDTDLKKRAAEVSEDYYDVLIASLRQSIAAHKLVKDGDGNILFLSKECDSNGCIATVDVSYPSMPLFLLYNTELVKGMMRPILDFAKMPVWKFDFAPHDVGTYPACCGQVYGILSEENRYLCNLMKQEEHHYEVHYPLYNLPSEFDFYDSGHQMPVEECANMIIMFAACYKYDNDISFFEANKALCDKWVGYLVKYGLKPENQLCTDDFAGHLSNNLNLAVKAVVGIGAYAMLEKAAGEVRVSEKYSDTAREYASRITEFAKGFAHMPLTWDSGADTFSLKYNFAFDKILGLGLFPQTLFESETDFYLREMKEYGFPLDNRKNFAKSDWLCWAASLTSNGSKRAKMIKPLVKYLQTAPSRVPFCDWYDVETGAQYHFQARSVQGACFILLL